MAEKKRTNNYISEHVKTQVAVDFTKSERSHAVVRQLAKVHGISTVWLRKILADRGLYVEVSPRDCVICGTSFRPSHIRQSAMVCSRKCFILRSKKMVWNQEDADRFLEVCRKNMPCGAGIYVCARIANVSRHYARLVKQVHPDEFKILEEKLHQSRYDDFLMKMGRMPVASSGE